MEKLYTVEQVAEILQMKMNSIYRYIYRNQLKHHKVGGAIRISESQLKEFLEKGK